MSRTMNTTQPNSWLLSRGRLTWDRSERISDRYGAVYTLADGDSLSKYPTRYSELAIPDAAIGRRVRLLAKVIETRESTHIGDIFNGVFPRTPIKGEVLSLGVGILRAGRNCDGQPTVELHPEDGRDTLWMLIRGLYDAHEQTVELIAEEVIGAGEAVNA